MPSSGDRSKCQVTCPRSTTGCQSTRQYCGPETTAGRVDRLGTPDMANDLWGESPLYENEGLKAGSIPTVTPIDQVQDEGNCGEVTNRGKEACECAGKLTENRRQSHSRQNCEATDRNPIQGRCGQASEPTITKPSSFIRPGQLEACAAKVMRLSQGDPSDVSATQVCLSAELPPVNVGGVGRKSAEVVGLSRRIPAATERTEPRRQGGATDDLGSSDFTPTGVARSGARRHASPERRPPSRGTLPGGSA
jgi:hypothetical protein